MAVSKDPQSTDDIGKIIVSNGDWQTLKQIAEAYGVNDEADIITFAIGVLEKANGGGVSVDTKEGRMKFVPSQKLKKTPPVAPAV